MSLASNNVNVPAPSPVTIAIGATSAQFSVAASPVATAQPAALIATAGGVSQEFAIQLAASPAALSLSTSTVTFASASLNVPSTQTVTLTSSGTSALMISAVNVSGAGFSAPGFTTPLTLNPNQTATLTVQFDPTASGPATGTVTIVSNAPSATINLSGNGLSLYALPNDNTGCPANCRQIPWVTGSDLWNHGSLPTYAGVPCTGLANDGTTDDGPAIQACINALAKNQCAVLPADQNIFVNSIVRLASYTCLRGAKPEGGPPFMPATDTSATQIVLGSNAQLTTQAFSRFTISGYAGYTGFPTPDTLSGSPQKGDASLTIGSLLPGQANVAVGDWIKVFGNDDPSLIDFAGTDGECVWCGDNSGYYVQQQIVQVTAITSGAGGAGSTITISRPLYYTPFTGAVTVNGNAEPAGAKFDVMTGAGASGSAGSGDGTNAFPTVQAGFENLRIDGSQNDIGADNILFLQGCLYCWVRNVETFDTGSVTNSAHVQLDYTYGAEVRDSAFHDERSGGGGAGYGIYFQFINSDAKVENNILFHNRHWVVFQGGGSGVAVLYNYADDDMTDDCTYFASGRTSHGAHPYFDLFEGNITSHLAADDFWGTSSHDVMFRNWIRGGEPDTVWPSGNIETWGNTGPMQATSQCTPYVFPPQEGFAAVDLYTGQSYYSYVDNVLGNNSNFLSGDTWSAATLAGFDEYPEPSAPLVYSYGGQLVDGNSNTLGASSATTIIRQGNYDYLTNGVAYNDGGTGLGYAPSMYYTTKPAFMGSCPFPAQGSDLAPVDTLLQKAYQRAYGLSACN